jgi:23S rRNA (adenine2503-C2)-methyltransferase
MDNERQELYELDFGAFKALLSALGATEEQLRAAWRTLYRRGCGAIDQLTALPPLIRARLAERARIYAPPVLAHRGAGDGETAKDLLQMADGARVEVVLLRYGQRRSGCISTQVGCACGCVFCATGQAGFVRDLTAEEIVAQVMHLQRRLVAEGDALTNIVLMGMGEPLLNTEQTLTAVRRLIDQRGLSLSPRRVTLSTVGIVPGIRRLAQEDLRINLALSLHAASDDLRERLIPINARYPLGPLFDALRTYTARTKQRVMIEWVLLEGVNDTPAQARALARRLADLPVHVNLIRLNPTPGYEGRAAQPPAIARFRAVLERAGIPYTMRQRRGNAIAAGCGQLRAFEQASSG